MISEAARIAQAFVEAVQPGIAEQFDDVANGAAVGAMQHVFHGLAWYATYASMMREVAEWARRLDDLGDFGAIDALLAQLLFAEYGLQLAGGIPMNESRDVYSSRGLVMAYAKDMSRFIEDVAENLANHHLMTSVSERS